MLDNIHKIDIIHSINILCISNKLKFMMYNKHAKKNKR
jgi:hypothetical protein